MFASLDQIIKKNHIGMTNNLINIEKPIKYVYLNQKKIRKEDQKIKIKKEKTKTNSETEDINFIIT